MILNHDYATLDIERKILADAGLSLEALECKTDDDVIKGARDAVGIINVYANMPQKVIDELGKCRVIVRPGVGYDSIDVEAATARGIIVCNVPNYCVEEVAVHTLSLMLMLHRKIHVLVSSLRDCAIWDSKVAVPIHRLSGLTLGLVGFGRIAQKVADLGRNFFRQVVAYDPFVPDQIFHNKGVQKAELEEVFTESDIISLHIPLTSATRYIVSENLLSRCRRKPILVNVSRGGLVNEADLMRALDAGYISAVGLDVCEQEPPKRSNPLLNHDNVIITPHAAWYSEEAEYEVRRTAASDVVNVLYGQEPLNPVNLEALCTVPNEPNKGGNCFGRPNADS